MRWIPICIAGLLFAASCTLKMPPPDYRPEERALQEPPRTAVSETTVPAPRPTRASAFLTQTPAEPALPTQSTASSVVQQPIRATSSATQTQPSATSPGSTLSVVQVASKVRPAVAQILVKGTAPDLFEPIPTSGVGSGAVFDPRGYVMTNNHVVADADEIVVTLPDREETYSAHLVGRDPSTDLAVIQIQGNDLPLVTLGDSDALQVGEQVVAIGNALGLEGGPTVTVGVVSALNRSIDEPNGETLHQLIQTDAAINPGNSGGPLVNMAGEVIGINTAVATGSSQAPAQGIGFAISINSAKPILQDLIAYGKVRRPYLGVELATVTPGVARQARLPVDHGVYIIRTVRGGPAAQAGLLAGDIITEVESIPIKSIADLRKTMSNLEIGQKVTIQVARGSGQRTFEVTLGEMPAP